MFKVFQSVLNPNYFNKMYQNIFQIIANRILKEEKLLKKIATKIFDTP